MKYFKKLIKLIFSFFNLTIQKDIQIDKITKKLINKSSPIVFDVGANIGQSILRYRNIFEDPIIHSFEPNPNAFKKLEEKFINEKNLFLNNVAIGENEEVLEFNISKKSSHSSFLTLNLNSQWLKNRAKSIGVNYLDYVEKKTPIKTTTLDEYAEKKNIEVIDVLKIDTQGFEDKVLIGAKNLIKNKRIKFIQLEIIFSNLYQNSPQIYDIEKSLIPFDYKLFGISKSDSLMSHYIFQSDFIYVQDEIYKKIISS